MSDPRVALVMCAQPWSMAFQRFCADHGGAKVERLVLDAATLVDLDYEVLIVPARWAALGPQLVAQLHQAGRQIVGVFDHLDQPARDRLASLGVDWMVEDGAPPEQFVQAVRTVAPLVAEPAPESCAVAVATSRIGVVMGMPGAGSTEVALGLASGYAASTPAVLVDAHADAPTVAQRLGLPLEPNLYDAALKGELGGFARVGAPAEFTVVPGFPSHAAHASCTARQVFAAIERLAGEGSQVIVDLGAPPSWTRTTVELYFELMELLCTRANWIVAVGLANPCGLTRVAYWAAEHRERFASRHFALALNRAPRDQFRRTGLSDELRELFPNLPIFVLPQDRAVAAAAWNGTLVKRGGFQKSIDAVLRNLGAGGVTVREDAPVQSALVGVAG